jgi:hypothetical protein
MTSNTTLLQKLLCLTVLVIAGVALLIGHWRRIK